MTKEKDVGFKTGDFVVYPTHGVGKIVGIETQEISGISLQVIIINFDNDMLIPCDGSDGRSNLDRRT